MFEMLCLEGAQAGLSWYTILKKREHYRVVFDGFDPVRMAGYRKRKKEALLADPGIVRNRLKVRAFIGNAKSFLAYEQANGAGSFATFLWDFVDGQPIINRPDSATEVPATTNRSDAMSEALKKLGFKFVGSTICYAFMQAAGLVDDHAADCFRATRPNATRPNATRPNA
jgi:DNA-3-methyladenine glycosylase I